MLSKFSVKKPYTVVVAVILVMILGFVAFQNMTVDLLPSMNLPYAMVMTTYPGASPEEVETAVTKPIEQTMATVSNIKNISSSSQENASTVILEFDQTANMDSATIEMRESLDQIKNYWPEGVGNPLIMKLNPTMMPIMVSAVSVKGDDPAENSRMIQEKVLPDIESVEGVASVSATGSIERSVEVKVNQGKVQALNEEVKGQLDRKFQEARDALSEAKAQVEEGKAKLTEGQEEAAGQMGTAEAELSKKEAEITQGQLEVAENLSELKVKETELDQAQTLLDLQEKALTVQKQGLEALALQEEEIRGQYAEVLQAIEAIEAGSQNNGEQTGETSGAAEGTDTETGMGETAGENPAAGTMQDLLDQKAVLEAQIQVLDQLGSSLASVEESLAGVEAQKQQLAQGREQLAAGKEALEAVKSQLTAGAVTLAEARGQMSSAQIAAAAQLSSASAQIASGEQQIAAQEGQLDSSKDEAYEKADLSGILTADMVKTLLAAENFNMPAGYVQEEGIDYLIRVGEKFGSVEDVRDLVLIDVEGIDPVKVSDVADVEQVSNSDEVYAKINGESGILLSIQKQTGYSTGDVSDRLLEKFKEIKKEQKGVNFVTLMDQGIYIDMVINSVLQNMVLGGILAVLILLLFLRNIRPTVVIAFSIPISILAAIVLMYFSGVTLNVISLSGLALGVGMLVDNSIVVIENIYRMRNEEGVPPKEAAIQGARQVAGAISASTLTTICVFAPIVFTQGITRQLFVDMGLTIAYSLLASLFVALTLVPMMSAGMLRKTEEKESRIFIHLQAGYEKLVRKALRWKAAVLIGSVVLLVVSGVLALSNGTAFMPEMESTQISLTVTTEEGTSLADTGKVTDQVTEKLLSIEDIEDVGAMAMSGGMMGGSGPANEMEIYAIVKEKPEHSNDELEKLIRKKTKGLDCTVEVSMSSMDMSSLGSSGVVVQIKGKELDTLQKIAKDVAKIVEGVKGTKNVSDGMEDTTEELRIIVDKAKATSHNLTVAQVFQEVSAKVAAATTATTLSTDTDEFDIYVMDGAKESLSREDIKKLTITAQKADGTKEEVALRDIAGFQDATGLQAISRKDQSRYMNVTAEVKDGDNIGLVSRRLNKALETYEIPSGYEVEMAGEDSTINDAMVELFKMLGLAIVFMYLIMVAQFQSLRSPFIIMFTIPLAFTGGLFGLAIAKDPVSVIAMIGFVMLSGIIVNNGIVFVDYTNQLMEAGKERREALVEAGKTRLRPILMTALTTILGLSTMAAGFGSGADMTQPMAIVTIGGLIYGTALTLFVVPCIYDLFHKKEHKIRTENEEEDPFETEEERPKIVENSCEF